MSVSPSKTTVLKHSLIILASFALTSGPCIAEYSKCVINGVLVYSDTKCSDRPDAEKIVIQAPPKDSMDNPEGAAKIIARKQAEAQLELQREQLQLQREQAEAQFYLKQQQMQMQQDLTDKSQGIGTGATWGIAPTSLQRREQADALRALKAVNGVPDIPAQNPTGCRNQANGSYGNSYGTTDCR